ncbi:nucleotidyl transferase AbiEii/AbiGii toxin family protein [Neptunomonas phycophila]|uniref:Nucleotidyl transferase AbiEii/AbiGii toxin family protein n=1 Tax=Neptunomonas phycophila TaxID=1572645 RepID=A0ABT9EV69_9GAMM|nr:nucleotidyl transferase AbiEii/AbiGii toxin family protein [Neptunomonas phycophila]MDP2522960.1 nucleotidyl transferase AbiEii/AbiGii toxin family protein [Neptunomonas phycophila]
MRILEYYQNDAKREELKQILQLGAQHHPAGLPDFFLEKDLWVTEILRLLYDEKLLGDYAVAFKGGTALSKCWKAIDRFSEDIDLSIHWADLAEAENELTEWAQSTKNPSQQKKFRERQTERLTEWSSQLCEKLNQRLVQYGIEGLGAELDEDSHGEKINFHYPRVTESANSYHLDFVLLEFGGRNRGEPTVEHEVNSYLAEVSELQSLEFPVAKVQAYDPDYIVWEKLTALHQFSTMKRGPSTHRLARHWYDVDCMLGKGTANPIKAMQARSDVVEMKKQRWPEKGVDYELILKGQLKLIPEADRLAGISVDHKESIEGRMFFTNQQPSNFEEIIDRVSCAQRSINEAALDSWVRQNVRWVYSGAWMQGVTDYAGKIVRSEMFLKGQSKRALENLTKRVLDSGQ